MAELILRKTKFTLPSYAKINLGLHITGKKPDGYHELATIFQQVSLHDLLTFELLQTKAIDIKVNVSELADPIDNENNLVYKAAKLFLKETKKSLAASIKLEKKIPIGAGLGGGSSNAAVTLLGLNYALGAPLSIKTLQKLATQLGADVSFFLYGGIAYATGIGDRLELLQNKFRFTILLLCPNLSISTKWAYSNFRFDASANNRDHALNDHIKNTTPFFWRDKLFNDFEKSVFSEYPLLENLKQSLYASGAEYASLSGSGSTLYGIFTDRETAKDACADFRSPLQYFMVEPTYWGLRELESRN